MLETIAKTFVWALTVYAALGTAFAVPFVWRVVDRMDSQAAGAGWGFRLLIFPGVAAFWPIFLIRRLREITEPPGESNPHRKAVRP